MNKNTVVVLDRIGFDEHRFNNGKPIIDSDKFNIHVLSMPGVGNQARDHECAGQYAVDLFDNHAVTSILDDINARDGIDFIVTLDEEHLLQCAELRETYGCYGRPKTEVLPFRNKLEMKQRLESEVKVPLNKALSSFGDAMAFISRHGKSVIKPVQGLGSERTQVVHNAIDLRLKMGSSALNWADYEIEKFVEGTMYHIDAVIHQNEILSITVSQYLTSTMDYENGLPLMAGSINAESEPYKLGVNLANKVVENMPIEQGVIHLEAFDTGEGEMTFCEVAIRPGGGGVRSQFYAATGIDLFAVYLYQELNLDIFSLIAGQKTEMPNAGYVLFPPQSGEVKNISDLAEFEESWLVYKRIYAETGQQLTANTCCLGKTALFCATGSQFDELVERLFIIRDQFKMDVSSGCCA